MSIPCFRDFIGRSVRLRVAEYGPPDAPPVLFLHGAFMDSRTWEPVAAELAADFRLLCPDLPGCGESEKPPPRRFDYDVDSLAEVIADLYGGLDLGRAAVVGHGLGGAVALSLTAHHPELVSRLVLVDALCHRSPPFWTQRALALPFVGGILVKQMLGRTAYRRLFRDWFVGPHANISNARIDAFFDALSSPAGRGALLATLRSTIDTRALVAQTWRLNTPTLILWGRGDRLHPAGLGQRLAREVRGAGFELLDSGHSPQEECPIELAQSLRRFLTEARASSY